MSVAGQGGRAIAGAAFGSAAAAAPTAAGRAWPAHAFAAPLLPQQPARCLRFIAEHPGSSSSEVQVGVGMRHLSQASIALLRLERDGLVHTDRTTRAAANSWRLTDQGKTLLDGLPEGLYD